MHSVQKNKSLKIFLFFVFLMLTLFWGIHIGQALNEDLDYTIAEGIVYGTIGMFTRPLTFSLYLNQRGLLGIGAALIVYVFVVIILLIDAQRHNHFQKDIACGSAQWNTDYKAYNKEFSDPVGSVDNNGSNNMILSQHVKLNLDGRVTQKNNNVCVVGGSGSGKSRFFVKPNLLEANCNYVITDPAGELLESTGAFLESQGYEIKVFNLVEMAKSDCYNPFDYIRDDLGVVMMIKCLIKNTTPPGQKAGDPFWEKSEEALLQALCFYLIHHREKKYRNFTTVMQLLRAAEIDERNPSFKSALDKMFDDVEKVAPNSIALKQYKTFKMGAGKTLKSILISCSVRLTVFNLKQIENLTGRDTIELDKMGEGKKALFVIIPSADSTYNFLVSMMYSQLFETLYFIAETQNEGKRLKSRVRFLLDEFANIGEIPEFTKKLSTMRKYEISCSIILQNLAQIKTMYKDDWQTILGNCDSFLFLGGQEYETVEYVSKELGEQTIVIRDRGMSNGRSTSASQNYKTTSRKLLTPDEVMRLSGRKCVLMIRQLFPFKDDKYDYPKHPNYKFTGDANPKYKYVNKKDNRVFTSVEVVDIEKEKAKAAAFAKAQENPSPKNKVVGDIKNAEGLAKTLNITSGEDVKERLTLVELTPVDAALEEISAEAVVEALKQGTDAENCTQENIADNNEQIVRGDMAENKAAANESAVREEKTDRRNDGGSTGSLVSTGKESEKELWDFDAMF